jgi:hypothetical protein
MSPSQINKSTSPSQLNKSTSASQVYHRYITKVETECLVKEKLDHLQDQELDYSNPPIEAAQRRRDCMC